MSKIISLKKLVFNLKKLRKNKKVVLCHGVFDILHHGHIKYFEEAKKKGDILIVSLTSDRFVNKGFGRPYFNFKLRSETLEAIQNIDFICESDYETAIQVIRLIKPDVYCKGLDYKNKKKDLSKNIYKEKREVEKNRGFFFTTSSQLYSSTNIINTRLNFYNNDQQKYISEIKKKFSFEQIYKKINLLKQKKVLIIGEIIIDEYIFCEALGKSGKEPFLAIKKNREERYLGGSGAIAMHIKDFAKSVDILSYIGDDNNHYNFIKKKINKKIKLHLIKKRKSPTIIKRRYVEENERKKLLGIYTINDSDLLASQERKIIDFLNKNLKKYDCIIVSDYGHGLITPKIAKKISQSSKFISLNAQINAANIGHHSLDKYKNLNCVIINLNELKHEMRSRDSNYYPIAEKFLKKIKVKNLVVTKGRAGASMFLNKKFKTIEVPSFTNNIVDKVGAGDCLFAVLSILLSSKIENDLSLFLSSVAASKSVETIGNSSYLNFTDFIKTINTMLK